ncbi:MAG: NnrS family protein [Candidatus Acidiferrales bacterium]
MDRAIAREQSLSRLLMTYIVSGLIFMLLPGTFLGVWNLIKISNQEEVDSIAPAWIQAHGHAQLFGWVGTFILGIGFYSIPKLRKLKPFALWQGWACWTLWVVGVATRWLSNIYPWHWRLMMPLSAAFEVLASLIFFQAVASHRPSHGVPKPWEPWIFVVIAATLGLMASLLLNLGASIQLALHASSPASRIRPALFDRFDLGLSNSHGVGIQLALAPRVHGAAAPTKPIAPSGLGLNTAGVLTGFLEYFTASGVLLLAGVVMAVLAIRFFEPAAKAAKTINVHRSFPLFIRIAYGWLLLAAALSVWASRAGEAPGIWGASRHALTVGFIAAMVFCVGQRILPSFCGMRVLWSPRLMLAMLVLLMTGCTLRVASEILAYQNYAAWAWNVLPVSALIELTAITLFAVNLIVTFLRPPVVVTTPLTMTTE